MNQHKISQKIRENEDEESSSAPPLKKMRVLDYVKTATSSQPPLYTSTKITKKIGDTIFTVNGRVLIPETKFLAGKDTRYGWRYRWETEPPHPTKKPVRGLMPYLSGTIGKARNIETELEAFNIYVTDNMLKTILFYTNEEIKRSQYYISVNNFTHPLDLIELKAFIGVLFLTAAKKYNNYKKNPFIWEENEIFNSIISGDRFNYIFQCLRFDRNIRQNMTKATDPVFGIRGIWKEFNTKCSEVYRPSSNCTVDELFVDYIGNVEYMLQIKKPQKSLLKAIVLCDSGNRYVMSGDFLIDENNNQTFFAEHVVENLTRPISGTNINITYGNDGFTSVNLAKKMFQQYKLTTVGTLNINHPEIPEDVIITGNRFAGSSIFLYNIKDELQLSTYYSLTGQLSILISNIHFESTMKQPQGYPVVLDYYNSTMESFQAIKTIYYSYSCARPTSNRHLAIFYTILDLASINSLHILNSNRSRYGKPNIQRVDFLFKLALDLIVPHAKVRMTKPNTTDPVKTALHLIQNQQQDLDMKPNPNQQNKDLKEKPNEIMKPQDLKKPKLKPKHQQGPPNQVKSVELTAFEQAIKWNQMNLASALNINNEIRRSVPTIPGNFTMPQMNSMIMPMYQSLPTQSLLSYLNMRWYNILHSMESSRSSMLYYNQGNNMYENIFNNMSSMSSISTMHQMHNIQQATRFVQQVQRSIPPKKY